jgi:hypothetical protein
MGMPTNEKVDALKAICCAVVDIILSLMLNTEDIMNLLSLP